MKILLFGKSGQIGWELHRSLAPLGEVIALGEKSADLCGDLANLEGIRKTIQAVKPDIIANAAAYTAVDQAESHEEEARVVNALAPEVMAIEAGECDALLIHYSTDYVFNGEGQKPWREDDPTGPLNIYGKTKLEGERRIRAAHNKHLIFRTSWVHAPRGNNFARTMLALGKTRDALDVINDQTGTPTGADLIADVTAKILPQALQKSALCGLYHLTALGETTWHNYARYVFDRARSSNIKLKIKPEALHPILSKDYASAARRPHNSRLDKSKLMDSFDVHLPQWQDGVQRTLAHLFELDVRG